MISQRHDTRYRTEQRHDTERLLGMTAARGLDGEDLVFFTPKEVATSGLAGGSDYSAAPHQTVKTDRNRTLPEIMRS